MLEVSYKSIPMRKSVQVLLDGRRVGTIRKSVDGWYYVPDHSSFRGEKFATLEEVQKSLES